MNTKRMVNIALFGAVLSVLSIIKIPLPSGVPITLQTFAVALCGYMLGKKQGAAAVSLYLLLGTFGLPVFSGMSAGVAVLAGPTGGFLFGFVPMAFLCGCGRKRLYKIVLGLLGLLVCHALGAVQYAVATSTALPASFLLVSAPYLVKDIPLVFGALVFAEIVTKRLAAESIDSRARVLL